ncbi:MAG: FapA family protein [Candidatus Hydrogenedentota bacterium]
MAEGEDKAGLRVSADKVYAEINLLPDMTLGDVWNLIRARGIVYGIKDERLSEAMGRPGEWIRFAEGLAPVQPVHSLPHYHFDTGRKPHMTAGENDTVNFKELGLIHNVKAGQVVATQPPVKTGIPGRDIFGQAIPVPEPKITPFHVGTHVSLSPDEKQMKADIDGRVFLDLSGRVCVDNQLTIGGDVGPATGNINFLGALFINGNVLSGYKVKAAADIEIRGTVESAYIDAAGELKIHGGVFGGGKAVLQSRKSIHVRHAQEATILCGDSLVVQESLLRVTAVAAKKIVMELGSVVGGTINAPFMQIGSLGSESGVRTVVELGISPRIRMFCSQLESEFQSLRDQLQKVRQKLHPLVTLQDSGKVLTKEDHDIMLRLENEDEELQRKILGVTAEIRKKLSDPAAHIEGVMDVAGAVRPGVVISTIAVEKPIGTARTGLKLKASRGQITESVEE